MHWLAKQLHGLPIPNLTTHKCTSQGLKHLSTSILFVSFLYVLYYALWLCDSHKAKEVLIPLTSYVYNFRTQEETSHACGLFLITDNIYQSSWCSSLCPSYLTLEEWHVYSTLHIEVSPMNLVHVRYFVCLYTSVYSEPKLARPVLIPWTLWNSDAIQRQRSASTSAQSDGINPLS